MTSPATLAAEEAVGRLLIVGFEGTEADEVEDLIAAVRPAGLIFFKRNYPGRPQALRRLIEAAQSRAEKILGRRLLMAIDHEGGQVQRLPRPYTQLPPALDSAEGRAGLAPAEAAAIGARELAATGFNFNLAPVLDLAPPGGGFIGGRSLGSDPERVADLGRACLEAFHLAGLVGAAKHFPGLGRAEIDPHHELPLMDVDRRSLEELDLRPFRVLIPAGLEAVMTTHALYPALDPDQPATFSGPILSLLKEKLAFAGAALTDDLEMGAVVKNYPLGEAAVQAVAAGHDLALICRRRAYIEECRSALLEAAAEGRLAPERLADAHRRSAALLRRLEALAPPAGQRELWFAELARAEAEMS